MIYTVDMKMKKARNKRMKIFSYIRILDTEEEWNSMDYLPKLYGVTVGTINQSFIYQIAFQAVHSINSYIKYMKATQGLGGKPKDYVVLLRLGWDNKASGFMVGDAGYVYFIIAKEKLKSFDFSQIYYNAISY